MTEREPADDHLPETVEDGQGNRVAMDDALSRLPSEAPDADSGGRRDTPAEAGEDAG